MSQHNSMSIPTAHIQVKDLGIIAPTVIMPGDPLRAKYIAETFLEGSVQFNQVRNIFGYTGTYEGRRVSVMASGMGMASIGIYSYELFKFYGVENIIRIGSCGAYVEGLNMYDIILVKEAWSESTFAEVQSGCKDRVLSADAGLNGRLAQSAKRINKPLIEGRIHSCDVFYSQHFEQYKGVRDEHGCIAVEMEAFALFANAKALNKRAACLLTVTDSLVGTAKSLSIEERQLKLNDMIEVALGVGE